MLDKLVIKLKIGCCIRVLNNNDDTYEKEKSGVR